MTDRFEEGGYFAFILVCADGSVWTHLSLAHSRDEAERGRLQRYREHLDGAGHKVETVHFVGAVEKSHAECQRLHDRVDKRKASFENKVKREAPPVKSAMLVGPGESLW